jgi:hypothetical protein
MPCPYTLPDLPHLLDPRAEILKKTIASSRLHAISEFNRMIFGDLYH